MERRLLSIAVGLFLLATALSVARLRYPNYGGDELYFAMPLVARSVESLRLFEFAYEGPLKTLLTWPIFETFGFSLLSVRIFSLMAFAVMAALWCAYLCRRGLRIAAAATLAFFAFNPDLQLLARDDINQPTLHNLVTVLHWLAFVPIVEQGPSPLRVLAFVGLSFIDVNDHIRNVWVSNAFLLAFAVDHFALKGFSGATVKSAFARGWPVLVGWGIGALEFAYVLVHFAGSPALEGAKSLAAGYSWPMRIEEVAYALPQLLAGGRVLSAGYGIHAAASVSEGVAILAFSALAWALVRGAVEPRDIGPRLLRLSLVVWIVIAIQYSLTKSARWPWHGNTVVLFWGIVFGLMVDALCRARSRELASAYAACVFLVFIGNRVALECTIAPSVGRMAGFDLAVWNPQSLDAVRDFVGHHPASYVFADWAIGRALALELRYRPQPGTTVTSYDSGISDEQIWSLHPDQIVLRAVGVGVTVPDVSDVRLERLKRRFHPLETFRDAIGREVYQVGSVVTQP